MTVYGYVRKDYPIATTEQLKTIMSYKCESIHIEENRLQDDKELTALLNQLAYQDTLIVVSLKVFGKNLKKMKKVIEVIEEKEIQLISKKDQLNTKQEVSFYTIFHLIAETDSSCQSQQVKQSLEIARSRGSLSGRPPIAPTVIALIKRYYYHDKLSMRAIASRCEVSLGTVHKYIKFSEKEPKVNEGVNILQLKEE